MLTMSQMPQRSPIGVIILNWNEANVSALTLKNLTSECRVNDTNDVIIFVDNGSDSPDDIRKLNDTITPLVNSRKPLSSLHRLGANYGPSIGRIEGIIEVGEVNPAIERVFVIDGDILYVPGTLDLYNKIFDHATQAGIPVGCVGCNNPENVKKYGMNGTLNFEETDKKIMPGTPFNVSEGIPIAWTQYGLFDIDALDDGLPIHPPFDGPGHGFEDDWLFCHMERKGLRCLSVNGPLYYHQASAGLRELEKRGLPSRTMERGDAFRKAWPEARHWSTSREKLLFSVLS